MKIALGAPVAERAWVLPTWLHHIAHQTLQPDYLCFVVSPGSDETERLLAEASGWEVHTKITQLPYYSRDERGADPKDPWRAEHMARLRNQLRALWLATDADIFVSLDTDVLLTRPDALEELIATIHPPEWDVACATTFLHPWGEKSECYNAGFLGGGGPDDFDQHWQRADSYTKGRTSTTRIDIPMACYAMRRHVAAMCSYKAHEQGEDVGFAQHLRKHKFRVAYRTDIVLPHVWSADRLDGVLAELEQAA